MKYIFKKYEVESQDLAETRIAALPHTEVDGESHPSHSHTVVKLGYIFTEQPTFDEEGNQEIDYPYGWVSKEIEVEGNGVHTFAGRSF